MPLATAPTMTPGMGPNIETDVDHGMTPTPMPGSLGTGQGQLATAMMGMVSDQRAAAQATANALNEMAALAQRLTVMLGGTSVAGGSYEPSVSVQGAAAAAAAGASYGTGVAGRPMIVNNYNAGPGFGPSGSQFGAQPVLPGAGPQYTQYSGVGTEGAATAAMTVPAPQGASGGAPGSQAPAWKTPGQRDREEAGGAAEDEEGSRVVDFLAARGVMNAAGRGVRDDFHQAQSLQGIAKKITNVADTRGWTGIPGVGRMLFGRPADEAAGVAARSGMISTFAETGEVGPSLLAGGGLEAGAGAVGAAYGAYRAGGAFLTDERSKNAAYQSVLGGSNVQAIGQRVGETLWGLGQWGTFSPGQASHIYQEVTGLGLTGTQRSNALGFVSGNYRSMGMSPDESIGLLTTSVQNAANDLDSLTASLQGVTQAARDAGVNADTFRQIFASTYSSAIGAFGGGSAALLAGGIAATQASEGWAGAAGGLDVGNYQVIAEAAAASGVTIGQQEARSARNPVAAVQGSQAQWRQWGRQALTSALGAGAGTVSRLEQRNKGAAGTIPNVTPESALGQAIVKNVPGGWQTLEPILQSMGVKFQSGNATSVLTAFANAQSGDLYTSTINNIRSQQTQAHQIMLHNEWVAHNPNTIPTLGGLINPDQWKGGGFGNDFMEFDSAAAERALNVGYHGYDAILHTGHYLSNALGVRSLLQRTPGVPQAVDWARNTWDSIFGGGGSGGGTAVLGNSTEQWIKTHQKIYQEIQNGTYHPSQTPAHAATPSAARTNTRTKQTQTHRSNANDHRVHVVVGFDQQAQKLLKVVAQNSDSDALQIPGNPQSPFRQLGQGLG